MLLLVWLIMNGRADKLVRFLLEELSLSANFSRCVIPLHERGTPLRPQSSPALNLSLSFALCPTFNAFQTKEQPRPSLVFCICTYKLYLS